MSRNNNYNNNNEKTFSLSLFVIGLVSHQPPFIQKQIIILILPVGLLLSLSSAHAKTLDNAILSQLPTKELDNITLGVMKTR